MPKIPRLNQQCSIYSNTIDHRGERTKQLVADKVQCRYAEASKDITNAQGEYVEYTGSLWLENQPIVEKGYFINLCEKDYLVIEARHTVDLNGNVLLQFLRLREDYAN